MICPVSWSPSRDRGATKANNREDSEPLHCLVRARAIPVHLHACPRSASERSPYVSGQFGVAPDGQMRADFSEQLEQAMDNVEALLVAARLALPDVAKATFFLTRASDLPALWSSAARAVHRKRPRRRRSSSLSHWLGPMHRLRLRCHRCSAVGARRAARTSGLPPLAANLRAGPYPKDALCGMPPGM